MRWLVSSSEHVNEMLPDFLLDILNYSDGVISLEWPDGQSGGVLKDCDRRYCGLGEEAKRQKTPFPFQLARPVVYVDSVPSIPAHPQTPSCPRDEAMCCPSSLQNMVRLQLVQTKEVRRARSDNFQHGGKSKCRIDQ